MSWILYPLKGVLTYGLLGGSSSQAATLLEAIRDRLLAAPSLSALGDNVYNRDTPPRSRIAVPYATISSLYDYPENTGGPTFPFMETIQVSIFHTSDTSGASLRDAAYKLFGPDQPILLFADGSTMPPMLGMRWEWEQANVTSGGNKVWGFAFKMNLYVTRRVVP